MNIGEYRQRKNKKKSNNNSSSFKRRAIGLLSRTLLTIILFLVCIILCKSNTNIKKEIYKYVYNTNFKFASFHTIYKKYLGNVIPLDTFIDTKEKEVFNEKLSYQDSSIYKDGVKLAVSDDYLVPILESGIVVYIGQKDHYKNTIIIQQINGIDVWYGNIKNSNVKMYDYIEKGSLLGEADGDFFYMVFAKEGKFLDYKKYI